MANQVKTAAAFVKMGVAKKAVKKHKYRIEIATMRYLNFTIKRSFWRANFFQRDFSTLRFFLLAGLLTGCRNSAKLHLNEPFSIRTIIAEAV